MTIQEKVQTTAACGLDCFNCPSHENNITDVGRQQLAAFFKKDKSDVACTGCQSVKGQCLFVNGKCATYACVAEKGVNYCFECNEFPCSKLMPSRESAENFPHNFKLYNLCRMKAVGVENWAANEADDIHRLYFTGKFVVGDSPQSEK